MAVLTKDRTTERILDAALAEAGVTGLRRMTVEDVARRAGVSRMTLYRRWPRREDLTQALVDRETARFLAAVAEGEDLTEAFVAAVRFARNHPMVGGDPSMVIDTVAADEGRLLAVGRDFIADRVRAAGVPARRARWVADVWARLFVSYVALPPDDPQFGDDRQLREFAREVLAPMVAA